MATDTPAPIRIPLEPIDSSNLHAIGWDEAKSILAVQFKNGAIFHYAGIERALATAFYCAESRGRFYSQQIRGKFQGQKMTGPCTACGAQGWIGDRCDDCGCGNFADAPRPDSSATIVSHNGSA
jgi:hypothetical protein